MYRIKTHKIQLLLGLALLGCSTAQQQNTQSIMHEFSTQPYASGLPVKVTVIGGNEYKYPIFAIWVEDSASNYLGTLYASKSISTGIFRYGVYDKGKWLPGERNRPAALPRWSHIKTTKIDESPIKTDAISGATPQGSFVLHTILPQGYNRLKLYLEVNKPWDFNNYWHNNRFPGDEEYATSGQPALIYEAEITLSTKASKFYFSPIGHSNPSGANGNVYNDVSTLTSALQIIDKAWVEIEN